MVSFESDGSLGGIAVVVGVFLVLVLVLLVVLWCSNVSAVTVSLGGVCLVCADSVFKLALTREGVEGEKAKGDQCCSTFRLQGLWPIYTATWLSLWIWLRVPYGFYCFYLEGGS